MKKLTKLRLSLVLLAGLAVTACGGNQIKPDIKKKINTAEVHIIIKQPEIYGAVVNNNSGGGLGIIGLIAATGAKEERVKRNKKAIKPVVKALEGYKVKSLAKRVYNSGLKKVGWMKPSRVKVLVTAPSFEKRNEIVRKSKADAVIFVELDYRLDSRFKAFELSTWSTMYYQESPDPAVNPKAIYSDRHGYKWELPNNADGVYDHMELGKKWSENRAKILKQKIKEGIEMEVQHMVNEMQKS